MWQKIRAIQWSLLRYQKVISLEETRTKITWKRTMVLFQTQWIMMPFFKVNTKRIIMLQDLMQCREADSWVINNQCCHNLMTTLTQFLQMGSPHKCNPINSRVPTFNLNLLLRKSINRESLQISVRLCRIISKRNWANWSRKWTFSRNSLRANYKISNTKLHKLSIAKEKQNRNCKEWSMKFLEIQTIWTFRSTVIYPRPLLVRTVRISKNLVAALQVSLQGALVPNISIKHQVSKLCSLIETRIKTITTNITSTRMRRLISQLNLIRHVACQTISTAKCKETIRTRLIIRGSSQHLAW